MCAVDSCKAVADPQSLLEEKEGLEEKLALSEYELRLAQEDILKLRTELQKKNESPINDLRGELPNLGGTLSAFILFCFRRDTPAVFDLI